MLLAICSYVCLITLNVLFGIGGVIIFAVGCIYYTKATYVSDGIPVEYQSFGHIPLFTILFGLIVILVALVGCWAAIQKNRFLLVTYSMIMMLFLVSQLVLGSYINIVFQSSLRSQAGESLRKDFDNYYFSEIKTQIDGIQKTLECCGPDGPCYWGVTMPQSCISPNDGKIYKKGCIYPYVDQMLKPFYIIGIIILCIAGMEALGVICAICLLCSPKIKSGMQDIYSRPSSSNL
ncbi:unnamed protein product [Acanthoscelides obtectus]|uniref:Tetraspanin n=1 Tax=Acanthoscelides obtectus TaxID=200917 RepID=A0A9P0NRV5_ACAOB|nr:unnamed protein product [Acanthoscelides obtectus]CAK1661585.1 CD63 antigen [Acanthoscelides obtectus]